jgi:hypothetical protein
MRNREKDILFTVPPGPVDTARSIFNADGFG